MAFFKSVRQVWRELDDNPDLYNFAARLHDEAKEITGSDKKMSQYSNETQESLKQFQAELTDALGAFNQSRNMAGFVAFSETCHNTIYDYQPALMAAPGVWNQLKALINNFLERFFNIEPCFGTNKSELSLKSEFRNTFNNTKNELSKLIRQADECSSPAYFSC